MDFAPDADSQSITTEAGKLAASFDDDLEEISLERFDRLAGPRGVERPTDAAARIDCPVVPELLR